jgi:hypothetical protein
VPGPYEGVHGFVFLYDGDPTSPSEVIERVREHLNPSMGPVFFASLFDGDFAGFAHFAADDLPKLVDFAGDDMFAAGVRSDFATEGTVLKNGLAQPMGPKRHSPRFCAICRVRTSVRPGPVLREIGKAFGEKRPLVGASRVIGNFHLLVELGTRDEDALAAGIDRLRNVSGVADMMVGTTDTGQDDEEDDEPVSGA